MAYRDATLLMKDLNENPPEHVLMAMRYGFYEARDKLRANQIAAQLDDMRRTVAQNARAFGRSSAQVKAFDHLPAGIQARRMARLRELGMTKEQRRARGEKVED